MARRHILAFMSLALAGPVLAQDEVHITDMPLFSLLAPCAQSALSANIMGQTSSCGENNNLQSCVCTKDNNYAAIGTSISSSLSYSCGETAKWDYTSAGIVYSAYCTPDKSFELPTPTTNRINELVTDVPELFNLARCAQSAVSYAAIEYMSSRCPHEPVAAFAGCICTRPLSSELNSVISSSVSWSCNDNADDRTSAQNFFSAYCAMGNGTTELPLPTPPPGDMTYYITAMPGFTRLASCAQTALDRVVASFSTSLCPGGPEALASCVCIKTGIFRSVSSLVTSSVKYSCESTALEDVTSAVNVLNQYCSEARGEATATGLESVEQTYAAATGRSIPPAPGPSITGSGAGPAETSGGATGGSAAGGGSGSDAGGSSGGGTSIGAIAGGVAAGAGAVLLVGLIAWLIIRRRKKAAAAAAATANETAGSSNPSAGAGKPELAGQPLFAPPYSPGPGPTKDGSPHPNTVSPVSPYGGYPPPSPMASELHGQGGVRPSEMPATPYPPPPPGVHAPQQWAQQGHAAPMQQQYGQSLPLPPELQGNQAQYWPPYGQPPQQVQPGQPQPAYGWQQGQYSELESGYQGGPQGATQGATQGTPHAR